MSHDIWGDRFAAVRVPAWHGIGRVYDEVVVPSFAAEDNGLLYAVSKYPLVAQTPDGPVDTGMVVVGRVDADQGLVNYGVASKFDLVMLSDVLPNLDELASRYPLSAAGALRQGAECFFTFQVAKGSVVVNEEYDEFLTVVHSYTPGTAHRFIYSPVRVVCQNTLITSEGSATNKVTVHHTARSADRLNAAYIVSDAMARAAVVKANLTRLSQTKISDEVAQKVVEGTYARYRPTQKVDPLVADLVADETMSLLFRKNTGQQRYFENLIQCATQAYATYNEEYPETAGTAYGLYQSIVEVADYRKGRNEMGTMESAVVGARAAEKRAAWDLLMSVA
jgi:hypothetical protein